MRDASPAGGIPDPHCPIAHRKGRYQRKIKKKNKIQSGSEHCWKLGTCTDKAPYACVVPEACPSSSQLPARPQTDKKKATLIRMVSPPLTNGMMRSSWLLFDPMTNNLIAKSCLHLGGFQVTWLGFASPTNGETTRAYTSK